jgi:hypothetical protein
VLGIVLIVIGIALLLHHGWHHGTRDAPFSAARTESCACACFFQLSDIANHETWVVVCFTNALSLLVLAPALVRLPIDAGSA